MNVYEYMCECVRISIYSHYACQVLFGLTILLPQLLQCWEKVLNSFFLCSSVFVKCLTHGYRKPAMSQRKRRKTPSREGCARNHSRH